MRRAALATATVVFAVLAGASGTRAAPPCSINWDGAATGSWHVATNWDLDIVPDGTTPHVCIGAGNAVTHSTGTTSVSTVQVGGELIVTGGELSLTSTVVDETSDVAKLTQTGGTISGAGTLVLTGDSLWSGGTQQGAGTTRVAATKTLTLDDFNTLNESRRLEVAGTLDFSADRGISSLSTATSLVHVQPGGLITRTTTAGVAFIAARVENDGDVTASSGTLELRTGGGADTASGDFGAPGQTGLVKLTNGTFPVDGASFLGGTEVSNATIQVATGDTAGTSGSNSFTGGTLDNDGAVQAAGALTWSGGTWTGDGTVTVPFGSAVTVDGFVTLNEAQKLDVAGVLEINADRGISSLSTATSLVHVLAGGVFKRTTTAGVAFAATRVENDGTIESPTGSLELRTGGGTGVSTGDYGKAGQTGLVKFTGGTFALDGADLLGGVEVTGGTLDVAASATLAASGSNTWSGGTMTGDGVFNVAGPLLWTGGTWTGNGTTNVLGAATVTIDDFVTLNEARRLEVAGTLSIVADRGISALSTATSLVHVQSGGSLTRTTTTGVAFIATRVENDGTTTASAGSLELRTGGGTDTASGTFGSPGQGGVVKLTSGTFTLAGATFAGGVDVAGATLSVPAGQTASTSGANTFSSGTLGGAGTFDIGGPFLWTGGTWNGTGVTRVLAGATVTHDDFTTLNDSRALEVSGILEFVADRGISRLSTATSSVWVKPGGLVKKTTSTGEAPIDPELRNEGTVEAVSGSLALNRGSATAHSGKFTGASAASTVNFNLGTHVLGAGVTLDGWTEIGGGTVNVADGVTVTADEHLVLSAGTLGGAGTLSVTGEMLWHGGAQSGPGTTTIAAAGTVEADGCSLDLSNARQVTNEGTLSINGGAIDAFSGQRPVIESPGSLVIDTSPGACFESGIYGNALIHITGTAQKLGSADAGRLEGTVDNDGTVTTSAGDLMLTSTSAVTQTGSFASTGPTGAVVLDDGVFELGPGASIAGRVTVASATLDIPAGMTLPVAAGDVLRVEGGTVRGDGTLQVLGTLAWVDGLFSDPGMTVIEPGGTGAFGEPFAFLMMDTDRQLVNRGAITFAGGSLFLSEGTSLLNAGSLEVTANAQISGGGFGTLFYSSVLHNTGTLRLTGGDTTEVDVALDNDGLIEATTGRLILTGLFGYSQASSTLSGGAYAARNATIQMPGPVDTLAARMVLDGESSAFTYEQSTFVDALGGLERIAGAGELELAGGRDVTVPAALRNDGVLRVGQGSKLTTTGGYQQTGVLRARYSAVGETRLQVGGAAQLGGVLTVETDPAFSPSPGTELPIATYASVTGAHATVNGLAPRPGLAYNLVQGATSLRFVVQGAGRAGAPAAPAEPEAPADGSTPVRIDDRRLKAVSGDWRRIRRGARTLSVAARRGATLRARGVHGRALALVAETCRTCGTVDVYFRGRLLRRVSLRSSRRAVRVLPLARFTADRTGTLRIRLVTSRRVAVDGLVVSAG